MDDLMIIELYFARDEQAIEETDTKYGKLCFHMANNFLSNDADAEECVNDTYLTAWNTIPPTRPNNFRAFLCKIVRNLSMKKLEFNLALKRTQNVTVSFSELEEVLPDTRTAPEWEYENLGKIITDFLQAEKEDVRNVFIRKYYFFDSISDIAGRYSFSESKVKNMLYHSRNIEKEAERQQTFFQNASHELKTPLMAIQGYAEGIQAGVMDAGGAAEVILAESDRMTELVEELLDISKIDMGRQLLAFSEMDIRELLYDSIRAVEPAAAGGIAIVPDFPEEPVMVSCDDTRLRRAVTNILSNGVRYARSQLRLTCRADKRHVTIRIQDDGDGIAEEDLPHIFDRFYMGRSGKSGIGLALTKEIVHLHRGTIRAYNVDTGAVFEITLPVSR